MSKNKIAVLRPKTWKEAVALFGSKPQFIFRGQSDARWGLSTKIERLCRQNSFPTTFLDNRESVILEEFQRRAHHYISSPPSLDAKLEWYALIQHFGGPTRLLDFTKSFYIAAFFSMETATCDAAVWALNDEYLYQHTDNTIREHETFYNMQAKSRKIVEDNLSHQHAGKVVMAAVPHRLNERIFIQQGLFAIPGDLRFSFEENLAVTFDVDMDAFKNVLKIKPSRSFDTEKPDYGIIKMILPIEIHNAALLDLASMNIDAATLFPGLEGFARSLNRFLRDVE